MNTSNPNNTTNRHHGLIADAEKRRDEARANYASALAAFLRDENPDTAGAKFVAEREKLEAEAAYEQVRMTFKQLRLQKVSS